MRPTPAIPPRPLSLDGMVRAVEIVRERLERTTAALEQARIQYVVLGGHAVAAWVASVDPAAVRTTPTVDVLLRREDIVSASEALEPAGLHVEQTESGLALRDAVITSPPRTGRVIIAGELVRPDNVVPAPDVTESVRLDGLPVPTFEALLRMKLTAFRNVDRMHLRDLMDVELLDTAWVSRLPPILGTRLQAVLDDPKG